MIKVCHMTSVHRPEDDRIFFKECCSLAAAGYDVCLVARGESYEKNGIRLVGVGEAPGNRIKRILQLPGRVYQRALEMDADIYHFHDPELLPYGLRLKKSGKKVIFDSHECYREQIRSKNYLPSLLRHTISKVYGLLEDYVLRQLDAVIFPCTMNGKNPFEGKCRRAAIISNAAILGEFFNLYDPEHKKIPNSVCYVGGLTEARGITGDIVAAAKADATIILAGEFASEEYEATLRQMPEFSCVEYRGVLNRQGVTEMLSDSCIGLCTLLDRGQYLKIDTFGIKVFEYMSMGLPVILSDSPYNRAMVEKLRFGICVDPDNTDEIAGAIRYLLDHPEEAKRMGENGRRAVEEEFNWGVEERKLLALYEEILKN